MTFPVQPINRQHETPTVSPVDRTRATEGRRGREDDEQDGKDHERHEAPEEQPGPDADGHIDVRV